MDSRRQSPTLSEDLAEFATGGRAHGNEFDDLPELADVAELAPRYG